MPKVWLKMKDSPMYVHTIQGDSRFVSWVSEKDKELALTFYDDELVSCLNILEFITGEKLTPISIEEKNE